MVAAEDEDCFGGAKEDGVVDEIDAGGIEWWSERKALLCGGECIRFEWEHECNVVLLSGAGEFGEQVGQLVEESRAEGQDEDWRLPVEFEDDGRLFA